MGGTARIERRGSDDPIRADITSRAPAQLGLPRPAATEYHTL